ncbi:type IV toxin-antitoxin system AbiEi family antitoxin [Blastococcus xanthinilyticus]|uniref:Transcriptional regulator with AbiEi antitoxin domain of type IV toxin-antitoxin system n=1 Tax=Blastococcus xanthinilyticus TaxID=1564164 RepID=A0A5S5CS29_9ACTN|nr:type IV toxin-antitoxin system AbiEi family antitoxin [Blastococcus xanthinilyticus]TYP85924.1 transcriptional regulator with AbiEi antitoxin domain of type IV toxin-antitoxin system [Blastococcus xanthinilyticus]
MTRTPTRPPELRGRIFRGSEQVRAGLLTPGHLRSSAWRRLFPDVYACASLPVTHERRARAVAGLLLPGATVSGRSAAVLWGVEAARSDDPVECTLPTARRCGAVRGVHVTRRHLPAGDVTRWRGVLVTTPMRTALDLARIQPADDAVVAVDQFLGSRLITLDDLRAAAAGVTGPGCRSIRLAVGRADGLAQSPQETRLRLLLHGSPLPRPVAQHRVCDADGRFVAQVDFGWPERAVAVEYDGVWHGEAQQVGKDRRRLNRLTAAGWTVIFVTAADLRDPVILVARIRAALDAPRYA